MTNWCDRIIISNLLFLLNFSTTSAPNTQPSPLLFWPYPFTPSKLIINLHKYNAFRVTPQQIAHTPFVGNLLFAVDSPHIIYRMNQRRKPPVHAQVLAVNDGRQRQIVKHLNAVSPNIQTVVLLQTLVVEPVHLNNIVLIRR